MQYKGTRDNFIGCKCFVKSDMYRKVEHTYKYFQFFQARKAWAMYRDISQETFCNLNNVVAVHLVKYNEQFTLAHILQ